MMTVPAIGREKITEPVTFLNHLYTAPTSFDPLNADMNINLSVMRLMYATPLEVSPEHKFFSLVLKQFHLDENKRKMTWIKREGIKFEDGSDITSDDIAFAVARQAHAMPKFPVIGHIKGLEKWLRQKHPLITYPEGLIVNGDQIQIEFDTPIVSPFFRFSLELLSIIPKRCVDLESSKLTCSHPPESGRYALLKQENEKYIFKKRGTLLDAPIPSEIVYVPRNKELATKNLAQLASTTKAPFVIWSTRGSLPPEGVRSLQKKYTYFQSPALSFSGIVFSLKTAPFDDRHCRQVFSKIFRESMIDAGWDKNFIEGSIFTKIVPGYLSLDYLQENSEIGKMNAATKARCLSKLKGTKLKTFAVATSSQSDGATVADVFRILKDKHGIEVSAEYQRSDDVSDADALFSGKLNFGFFSSGFWPADPANDVKMLFTPNLHLFLKSLWHDRSLQSLTQKIALLPDSPERKSAAEQINLKLFNDSMYAIVRHSANAYLASHEIELSEQAFSIGTPSIFYLYEKK